MKAAVTGATGFIGSHVARTLARRGAEVLALHRRATAPPPLAEGVRWMGFAEWEREAPKVDALVHVAAVRHRHGVPPSEYGRQNVELTASLLAARDRIGRFVDVSSIAVFGWPKTLPIDESFPFDPVGPYGRSKVQTEEMVRTSGIDYAIVRPSITYGPGDTNGMIDKLFRLVRQGAYRVVGSGRSRVQLVYVEDLAHGIVEAATRPELSRAEYICTYREPIEMRELSRLAGEIVGRPVSRLHVPKPVAYAAALVFEAMDAVRFPFPGGEPPVTREKLGTVLVDRAYRIDRMRGLLGWEPPTGYAEGLRKTHDALYGPQGQSKAT